MNKKSDPRELPTKKRTVIMDDAVRKSFRRFATSTGLTSNLALHALLNCFDAHGDLDLAHGYVRSYEPGPTKIRNLISDDTTYARLRGLAAKLKTTSNVALAVLLECFREHGGPVRVEGAGLRVPCPIDSPCAPDAPSAGPAAIKHVAPTRLRSGTSAGPAVEGHVLDGPGGEKARLLRELIDEEENRARVYRQSAALLSALAPDA